MLDQKYYDASEITNMIRGVILKVLRRELELQYVSGITCRDEVWWHATFSKWFRLIGKFSAKASGRKLNAVIGHHLLMYIRHKPRDGDHVMMMTRWCALIGSPRTCQRQLIYDQRVRHIKGDSSIEVIFIDQSSIFLRIFYQLNTIHFTDISRGNS